MKKLQYSDDLWDILVDINDDVATAMMDAENTIIDKGFSEFVDVSDSDFSFDVKIDGIKKNLKVGTYLRTSFPDQFTNKQIVDFVRRYNSLKSGEEDKKPELNIIEVPKFSFNPKDVRSTFISLVTQTYPHGHEEEVVPLISQIGLQKDEWGNYYKIIGESTTMFTSHLDTADRQKSKVNLVSEKTTNGEIIRSDGTTILGADDKSGVSVMLYMMSHNIPGIYYFFIGEERGGIGSRDVSYNLDKIQHLSGVKKCVSFDRRNYYSVVTSQFSVTCCSDEFGNALAKELAKSGLKMDLDPTGVFTDSASFMEQIPECTNVSVGYFDEHTKNEHQNITFLEKLAEACIKVDWENLPVVRKVGLDEDVLEVYGPFLDDFKRAPFICSWTLTSQWGDSYIRFMIDEIDFEVVKDDIMTLSDIFKDHRINPDIYFDEEALMIELSNDDIKFKKYYSKYMESFKSFNENIDDDDDWEDDFMSDSDVPEDDDIGELCFWLKKMYEANKLEVEVEPDYSGKISIFLLLKKKEKISTLLSIMEITEKIKKDFLNYHDVEVELYESKSGYPIFAIDFTTNGSDTSDDYDEPF